MGLDTSTPNLVLGLYSPEEGILGVYENGLEPHATKQIIPQLDKLLTHAQLTKTNLAGITVGVGPGSYTGIRVAIATAKGLAKGLKIPLQGKSTLEAIAYKALAEQESAIVALDARRGNVYYGMYSKKDNKILTLLNEEKANLDKLRKVHPSFRFVIDTSPSAAYLASFTNFTDTVITPIYL